MLPEVLEDLLFGRAVSLLHCTGLEHAGPGPRLQHAAWPTPHICKVLTRDAARGPCAAHQPTRMRQLCVGTLPGAFPSPWASALRLPAAAAVPPAPITNRPLGHCCLYCPLPLPPDLQLPAPCAVAASLLGWCPCILLHTRRLGRAPAPPPSPQVHSRWGPTLPACCQWPVGRVLPSHPRDCCSSRGGAAPARCPACWSGHH